MTRIRVMGTFGIFFERSDLLRTIYAINHTHCTHWKLNVHNGIAIDNVRAEVERYGAQDSIAINRAKFIVTDPEKYTSYEDEIKSSIELKECSNFHADFKPDINCTAKLQVPEQIESCDFRCDNFWSISEVLLQ